MSDCFHEFLDLFKKKGIPAALSKILPHPDIAYDSLLSGEMLFANLVNYADSVIYGTGHDIYLAGRLLHDRFLQNKELAAQHPDFIAYLKTEQELLSAPSFKKALLAKTTLYATDDPETQNFLDRLSPHAQEYMESKIRLSQGWIDFQKTKPQFADLCIKNHTHFTPLWLPLKYLLPLPEVTFDPTKIPLIFPEPLDCDFSKWLSPLENKPAIFVFETYKSFLSMLQFPSFVTTLKDPQHLLYILGLYPNEQLAVQNRSAFQNSNFQPVFFTTRKRIEATLPTLIPALKECLEQTDEALKNDSEPGNWLYQTGKRLLLSIREERLGLSRAAALLEITAQQNWHDPHKGLPPKEKDLGPPPYDNMALKLSLLPRMPARKASSDKKLKLVHIVPQIIDAGHAPSLLLENLLVNHNRERFEVSVISTERMQFRLYDYPYSYYISQSSQQRAPKRLELIKSLGISVEIQNNYPFYEFSAYATAAFLNRIKADIAVFHGPDAINYMAATLTDTPLRVLFEHGTPPVYPGFDLAIVSSPEAMDIFKNLYTKLKTDVRALPYQLDARAKWETDPYPKEKWGLPKNCKVMTTISNHLDERLGSEMSIAIAEILQRIPEAYYVPMGRMSDQKKELLNKTFREYRVDDRVVYLGSVSNPSQCARSMDLYLNEFPFGSGLGILDAMAAGCPIVSMYDENGPQQGRYGGHYFGIDRAVVSGKMGEYVALACRLLSDPEMYGEWSAHAVQQYEKQADVKGYVKKFESIIEEYYLSKI